MKQNKGDAISVNVVTSLSTLTSEILVKCAFGSRHSSDKLKFHSSGKVMELNLADFIVAISL